MPRGGYRPGSGRPKGSKTKNTRLKEAIFHNAKALTKEGVPEEIATLGPLHVMARVMTTAYHAQNYTLALQAANYLAPYTAPKLSHQTITTTNEPAKMSDNELSELLADIRKKRDGTDPDGPNDGGPTPDPEPQTEDPDGVLVAFKGS